MKENFTKFPQTLINLRVKTKPEFMAVASIASSIRNAEQKLGDRGRVVVRYSGTEPLARVMVEGEDADIVESSARDIAGRIEAELA